MPKRVKGSALVVILLFTITSSFFTSCKTYSNYHSQQINADSLLRSEFAMRMDSDTIKSWQEMFSEPQLVALIEEGLVRNSDLNIAKLHVEEAQAMLRHAKGQLFPSLEVGGEGETARFRNIDIDETQSNFALGVESNWELDIFGKMQNARKAAAASVEEQMAYVQAVRTELIATIATSYYRLEMLDAQIADLRQLTESWDESIQAQKSLMTVGQATIDDVEQAEAGRLEAGTKLEELQMELIHAENALCTVLGRRSGHVERADFRASCEAIPVLKGIPIRALALRPDIRQAEAALKSAFYLTNEARAAFYPSLTLTGNIGYTNNADEVINPAGLLMKALASLTAPIFANGKLKAELRKAKAEQEVARISFKQAILEAGQEVNDALASQQYAQKAILLNEQQVEKLSHIVQTSKVRMKYDDEVNYLQVLLARQSLIEASLSLNEHRFEFIEASIQLFRALGGGMLSHRFER